MLAILSLVFSFGVKYYSLRERDYCDKLPSVLGEYCCQVKGHKTISIMICTLYFVTIYMYTCMYSRTESSLYLQVLLERTYQTHLSLKKRNPLTSSKLTLRQSCAKTLVPQWYANPPSSDTIPAIVVSGRPPDLVTSPPLRAASQSHCHPLM